MHEHARGHFTFVVRGEYEESIAHSVAVRHSGDLLWHPAGAAHAERHGRAGRHLMVEPSRELERSLPDTPRCFAAEEAAALGPRLLIESTGDDELALEAVLQELRLVLHGPTRERGQPAWVSDVEDQMRSCFREALRLDDLAATAGVAAAHLARTWRRLHGRTIGEELRRLRIGWACRRVASSERSLAEIAAEAGFADQAHLARSFRKLIGCTPSQYRERARR